MVRDRGQEVCLSAPSRHQVCGAGFCEELPAFGLVRDPCQAADSPAGPLRSRSRSSPVLVLFVPGWGAVGIGCRLAKAQAVNSSFTAAKCLPERDKVGDRVYVHGLDEEVVQMK